MLILHIFLLRKRDYKDLMGCSSGALSQVVPEGKSRQRRQTGRTTSASEEDARPFTVETTGVSFMSQFTMWQDGNESGQEEATTREVARVAKYSGFV
jgi:hypothetical protein